MKPNTAKLLNLYLILTSLAVYLEWGTDNTAFLFEAEVEVIAKLFSHPAAAIHPLTLMPLAGQILLLVTLVQRKPARLLTLLGTGGIGLLIVFIFVVGLLSANPRILGSTIPFLLTAIVVVRGSLKAA